MVQLDAMGRKGTRSKAPKPQKERDDRREMVLAMIYEMRPTAEIYRTVCKRFDVTSATVRRDMRWAGEQAQKDLSAADKADPAKVYMRLDAIEDLSARCGAAAPILDRDGQPLMGRTDDGEEFPVMVADAKLLTVAIKASQAKMTLFGWRDSVKWKRSLQHQQVELAKAKTELAKEQLVVAERDRRIEEERKALLAAKTARGGIPVLQEPDQKVLDRMSRFLILGKEELEPWVLSHSREEESEDVEGDDQDDGDGRPDELGVGASGGSPDGGSDGPGPGGDSDGDDGDD
jgi:hypothetical protein